MSAKFKKKVTNLSQPDLADLVNVATDRDIDFVNLVKLKPAENETKLLIKYITQEVHSIKRSKRFLGSWEADAIGDVINQLLIVIGSKLLTQSPKLAAKCCEKILSLEATIFNRADDSFGGLSIALKNTVNVWGKAVALQKNIDVLNLVDTIYTQVVKAGNDYGIFDGIILAFSHALGKEGLAQLENKIHATIVVNNEWLKFGALKDIADAEHNVNKYISICQKEACTGRESVILDIARRLNNAARGAEALEWLMGYNENHIHYSEYTKLLIEAYLLEGLDEKAQEARWVAFEKTLSSAYYYDFIRCADKNKASQAKKGALQLANDCTNLNSAMHLLEDLLEHSLLADFIYQEREKLEVHDYSWFRNLSKVLNNKGQSLAAVILRRALANSVLAKAKSKYYKYAVSDIKLAGDYAENISDWKTLLTHDDYMTSLKHQHTRKTSFLHEFEKKFSVGSEV